MGMPQEDRERRTLPATARRREDFRRRGVLARSPDTGPAMGLFGLLVAAILLAGSGGAVAQNLAAGIRGIAVVQPLTPQTAVAAMVTLGMAGLYVVLPVLVVAWVMVVVAVVATQGVSFNFAPGGLARLNPLKGFTQLFSRQSLSSLGVSVLKLAGALTVGMTIMLGPIEAWVVRPQGALAATFAEFHATLVSLVTALAGVGLLIGAVSALLARRRYESEMRMTPEEMREETRRNDGDPQLRRRRLSQHRRMLRQRLVEAVRGADVVVTNPTHLAVALVYKPDRMQAPEVVAKGADQIAARMREQAQAAGVPVVENRPLARALWADVEVGAHVPPALFLAVAEVLAFVYRRRGYVPTAGGMGR